MSDCEQLCLNLIECQLGASQSRRVEPAKCNKIGLGSKPWVLAPLRPSHCPTIDSRIIQFALLSVRSAYFTREKEHDTDQVHTTTKGSLGHATSGRGVRPPPASALCTSETTARFATIVFDLARLEEIACDCHGLFAIVTLCLWWSVVVCD